ncbi:unnamed protein product [Ilex paraguariensis]
MRVKQFYHQNIKQAPVEIKESSSQKLAHVITDKKSTSILDGSQHLPCLQNQHGQPDTEQKRTSVHDRIRVPVTYDDLLEQKDPIEE